MFNQIQNDKQLNITRRWLERFSKQLANLRLSDYDHPLAYKAASDSLTSMCLELERQIEEYTNGTN